MEIEKIIKLSTELFADKFNEIENFFQSEKRNRECRKFLIYIRLISANANTANEKEKKKKKKGDEMAKF